MKKYAVMVALFLACGGLYAQAATVVSAGMGGSVSFPALMCGEIHASCERYLIPSWVSVSATVEGQFYPMGIFASMFTSDPNLFGWVMDVEAHVYPFRGGFHIDGGVGYGNFMMAQHSFVLPLGLGKRYDFGDPGGIVFDISGRLEIFFPVGKNIFKSAESKEDPGTKPVNIGVTLNLGYAF